jgi:D-alanyl-lipoteichoic acid acyltransferase DltB (MBOAT superfamily)
LTNPLSQNYFFICFYLIIIGSKFSRQRKDSRNFNWCLTFAFINCLFNLPYFMSLLMQLIISQTLNPSFLTYGKSTWAPLIFLPDILSVDYFLISYFCFEPIMYIFHFLRRLDLSKFNRSCTGQWLTFA